MADFCKHGHEYSTFLKAVSVSFDALMSHGVECLRLQSCGIRHDIFVNCNWVATWWQ